VVACNSDWAHRLRHIRVLTGALLHPLAAYLLHRSLPTLPLRVRAAQAGARSLAERLAAHDLVSAVHYPGLPGSDPLGLIGRQMAGAGSMLAFEVKGGHAMASAVMRQVRLAIPAVSLGSTDTLIQHPAGLTHRVLPPAARAELGISEGLLRLSVGIEDPEDLWSDLERALVAAAVPAATR
jgi:cystathionine beta-lyase/cystathionine gamma-synthase